MELELAGYFRFLLALVFVLGLIAGAALLAKKFGLGNRGPVKRAYGKRLAIIETMALDAKRRLVLISRDGNEHLILMGNTSETVIETGIDLPERTDEPAAPPSRPFLKALTGGSERTS